VLGSRFHTIQKEGRAMTRGKGTGKKILSITEREGLIGDKKELEAELRASEYGAGTNAAGINKEAIKKEIVRLDKEIHDGAVPKVSGIKKDALLAEANQLKEEIKVGMPTQFEMDHPAKAPGAIHKHLNWDKRNAEKIRRYKDIMRILEPQDPTAALCESWRKEK